MKTINIRKPLVWTLFPFLEVAFLDEPSSLEKKAEGVRTTYEVLISLNSSETF